MFSILDGHRMTLGRGSSADDRSEALSGHRESTIEFGAPVTGLVCFFVFCVKARSSSFEMGTGELSQGFRMEGFESRITDRGA